MTVAELADFAWQAFLLLVSSYVFWGVIAGALLLGYLLALAVSQLQFSQGKEPSEAAAIGFTWGFVLALLICCATLYFLWPLAYLAVAGILALIIVLLLPLLVLSTLRSRSHNAEV